MSLTRQEIELVAQYIDDYPAGNASYWIASEPICKLGIKPSDLLPIELQQPTLRTLVSLYGLVKAIVKFPDLLKFG